jgi:two-component system OmpR family response regulator
MDLLLLEDDEDLGQAVRDHLVAAGHRLQWCRRIADTETATPWDMALLDLHLGDGDGLDLLRRWRQAGRRQPVIVLTARDQVSDRIRGLQAGADDYLVKPFDLDELLARVDAVARRTGPAIVSTNAPATAAEATMAASAQPLAAGALRLDALAHALWRDGLRIDLTQMEWAVLDCLAQHTGRIYSRNDIEDRLHRQGLADASSNSLEVIVSRLRKKLGAGAISTHRGLGYRLEA